MVWCSICSKGIATNFNCNTLGKTHLKIGINAFLLNDCYQSNTKEYEDSQAFQVFCTDCYINGHYLSKVISKYQTIFQKFGQSRAKQLTAKYENQIQEQKKRVTAVQDQLKKSLKNLQQYNSLQGLYKRFQSHYKQDKKKMMSLQSFKKFGKEMGLKDLQFKRKLNELYSKMEKQYLNSSIIRIQSLFSAYIKSIDQRIKLCQDDISKIKQLQLQTIRKCSLQKSSFLKQGLMNQGRLNSMKNLFQNQITNYQKILVGLKMFKESGIIQFNIEEFQLSKMNRSFYQISDAEMHQNSWDFRIIKN